jgi:SAM-dependent methyltransferase
MPEAAAPLFRVEPGDAGASDPTPESDDYVCDMAEIFCAERPYAQLPYAKRNWGGRLHSLCSYQGKLKPSIAHFLIAWFTRPGDTVLDPMSGVGTIPLEARLQGRRALASDLSELAIAVSRTKVESSDPPGTFELVRSLSEYIAESQEAPLDVLIREEEATFGLNGSIVEYFHPQTLREVLLARRFFHSCVERDTPAAASVMTALLHILHGNRPYALSRRSHPVTPLKPTGDAEYRPLLRHLGVRLEQTLPLLLPLEHPGEVFRADFGELPLPDDSVDAVVTSPPFAQSLRFFSSNWMRLWFCGWSASQFRDRPGEYLENEQRFDFDAAYRRFLKAMHRLLKPDGLLVLHVGATRRVDMAARIAPLLTPDFALLHEGVEHLDAPESHGLSDKGATLRHAFLFSRAVK